MLSIRYGLTAGLLILAAGCATTHKATAPASEPVTQQETAMPVTAPIADWPLLPAPRTFEVTGSIAGIDPALNLALENHPQVLRKAFVDAVLTFPRAAGDATASHRHTIALDPTHVPTAQGYEIVIAAGKAGAVLTVTAHDEAGLFYAAQTLRQLAALSHERGVIPVCHIADYPDFPNRGVMIDVARDKVPEMKTLYELVDLFASWKYNQLQMYTEHTFAYKGHHTVWEDASPMTPAQIRDLDRYCRERYIQLIPNQNSFGHMNRWLSHPEYAGLAETPNGSDLCPVDPGSIELLRSMYSFMLPNFSSPYFNVGCDETWSLGKGRSKEAVEQRGVGRVYLEFLLKIRDAVKENGKDMQFWADIINNHPELIPELPKDLTAMEWGYEANHPYAEHTKRFHDNGVRFYVVPGTSSWNTFLGRTANALGNIRNAAENGIANGGEGFLITDWGDGGHWQFQPVSYVPFLYGAATSWCFAANKDIDVAAMADRYAFYDSAGVMGKVACDLGNAQQQTGMEFGNSTLFYVMLQRRVEEPLNKDGFEKLKAEDLDRTIAFIDGALARLDGADMKCPDAELIKAEFRMNAALAKFACRLGAARIRAGGVATSALPRDQRLQFAAELEPLIPEYRQLWLARNRSGGLKDSAGRFENLVTLLKR
ncbi:MAG: family 20 glycosylhydrolase [Candidatus Hydrogenedentes bacterium]|nr:family 20 glycosylhydrolase [Candidatus Hydrogenedentota bacterium]